MRPLGIATSSALIFLALLYSVTHFTIDRGDAGFSAFWDGALYAIIEWVAVVAVALRLVAARGREQRGWLVMTIGMALYAGGALSWSLDAGGDGEVGFPSIADAFWLASYPCFAGGLILLLRARAGETSIALWLDGLIGGLTVGAVALVFFFPAIEQATGGTTAAIATNLAYPLADAVLMMIVASGIIIVGRYPGPSWMALTIGFAIFALGDTVYVFQVATDTYKPGPVDLTWIAGSSLIGLAAWVPMGTVRAGEVRPRAAYIIPTVFATSAFFLLMVREGLDGDRNWGALVALTALAMSIPRALIASGDTRRLVRVRKEAYTDELTGLSNRRHFFEIAERALLRQHDPFALCMVDLDRFKDVNDSYGHRIGDELLMLVARRLEAATEPSCTVARLGGDEFGLLMPGSAGPGQLRARAEEILQELSVPYRLGALEFQIGASIGITTWPHDGSDIEALVANADMAMYEAKRDRTGIAFYEEDHHYDGRDRLRRVQQVRQALLAGEMVLHYQPILDVALDRITEMEALVRWKREDGTYVQPGEFLPLLRDAGLMSELTRSVLDQALHQVAEWRRDGWKLRVAINVGAPELLGDRFLDHVKLGLKGEDIPASLLVVEITEDALVEDFERARAAITALRDMGVRVSIDDFGVGYSSLSQLHHLEVDTLKIDRSIVSACMESRRAQAVLRSAITLAHGLAMNVCGEGVESAEMLSYLRGLGCDRAQGFYIARPAAPAELAIPEAERTRVSPRELALAS